MAGVLLRFPVSLTYRDGLGLTRRTSFDDELETDCFLGIDRGLPADVVALVHAGDTTVDAGANIGIVAGQLCQAVGPSGVVYAIEPLPANLARLTELKSDNALPQLVIEPYAVSDRSGTATLRIEALTGTSGHASFTASWIDSHAITVETRPIDDIVPESTRVSVLKLDVEGAESVALDGATRVMTRDRPVVFCEFNDIVLRDAGSSSDALLAKFADLGYAPAPEYSARALRLVDAITDLLLLPT